MTTLLGVFASQNHANAAIHRLRLCGIRGELSGVSLNHVLSDDVRCAAALGGIGAGRRREVDTRLPAAEFDEGGILLFVHTPSEQTSIARRILNEEGGRITHET